MKKPTGKSGAYGGNVSDIDSFKFEKIPFPDDKDEIENYIVSCFISSAKKKYGEIFFITNPKKNELDDFDFFVTTPRGDANLELMEIAPLELHKGRFDSAPNCIDRYEIAEYTHSKILAKSRKYPDILSGDLFLLLYVTDYKFILTNISLQILRYFCHKSSIKFNYIFMYSPLDETEGVVDIIYPSDDKDFDGFDPEQFRGDVISFNPDKFEIVSNISPDKKPKRTD